MREREMELGIKARDDPEGLDDDVETSDTDDVRLMAGGIFLGYWTEGVFSRRRKSLGVTTPGQVFALLGNDT